MSETVAKAPADGFVSPFPATRFDAILVVSFGGPEGMDDVIPFLENVTRGRNVPRERLEEVAHHYELFGGVSPINAQNRALIAALRPELDAHGIDLPIYFGNRNWHPFLADTLREMADDGVERALAFFTSAYSLVLGLPPVPRGHLQRPAGGRPGAPEVVRTRMFFNHPGWIEANADHVRTALGAARPQDRPSTSPSRRTRSRSRWRRRAATRTSCASRRGSWRRPSASTDCALVYQSRSGPPQVPWLEPDILDHLRDGRGARRHGRRDLADRLRLRPPRGAVRPRRRGRETRRRARAEPRPRRERGDAPGVRRDDPRADRGAARTSRRERRVVGRYAASHDVCPTDCCLPGHRAAEPVGGAAG